MPRKKSFPLRINEENEDALAPGRDVQEGSVRPQIADLAALELRQVHTPARQAHVGKADVQAAVMPVRNVQAPAGIRRQCADTVEVVAAVAPRRVPARGDGECKAR